jgi:A/G-specific adenine glycosylase
MNPPTPRRRSSASPDPDAPEPGTEPLPPAHLRSRLLAFFDARSRDLPWRRTADPYAIWVSEIMLQQTRVETVIPYFRRWMERFPDVEALASAPREEVMKAWEGLGYYRRARMLHEAAGIVRDRHDGSLPATPEGLRSLPGIGPYTAGAVASIAFAVPEPAVDGNVRRVLARLLDLPDPGAARLRKEARRLVDPERPGDFNQALMELGATVCTPRSPECTRCPVASLCRARARGVQEERPLPRGSSPVPHAHFAVAVMVARGEDGPRVLLARRPDDGMLGGLWEFPGVRLGEGSPGGARSETAAAEVAASLVEGGREPVANGAIDAVEHLYSHLRATYHPRIFSTSPRSFGGRGGAGDAVSVEIEGRRRPARWVTPAGLDDAPLPRAQRRIAAKLADLVSGWPEG